MVFSFVASQKQVVIPFFDEDEKVVQNSVQSNHPPMLPINRRIPRKDFPFILQSGRRINSPHILAYILKIDTESPSRFSFSVSKKVAINAVDRNKYRRQGYSIISKLTPHIQAGYKVFFSFKKGTGQFSFKILESEVISLLRTSGVIL